MGGLRIYHVHPRLAGPIDGWSGLSAPGGKSWLIEQVRSLGLNAIWFGPLYELSNVFVTDRKTGTQQNGSLYAIRKHKTLGAEFSAAADHPDKEAIDKKHFLHFANEARQNGILMMADLVFNHIAADNEIVTWENDEITAILKSGNVTRHLYNNGRLTGFEYETGGQRRNYHFKFARNENMEVLNFNGDVGGDTAQINYDSPAARAFFIDGQDGKKGYWKQVIDWHFERGFGGFRCDIAYKLPPDVWSALIQYAHDQKPGVQFMAETLGAPGDALNRMKQTKIRTYGQERLGWDLAMSSTHWWDFKGSWFRDEAHTLNELALYGGAGSPDNHDTDETIAGHFMQALAHVDSKHRAVQIADICMREYAVSALICNSVYMQMGYEYCRGQYDVFKGQADPGTWEQLTAERAKDGHPYNLITRIRAINDFKATLDAQGAIVELDDIRQTGPDGKLIELDCTLYERNSGKKIGKLVLFINEKPENGPVLADKNALEDKLDSADIDRLILGPKDDKQAHRYEIHDVAAFYTPLAPMRPTPQQDLTGDSPAPSPL